MLLEKSAYFGGSTARSGGGVWIPGNYALATAGQVDAARGSPSSTSTRSSATWCPKVRRDTYIDRGPEVMDFIKATHPAALRLGARVRRLPPRGSPAAAPRGRSVEPVPMDARFLGDELDRLHPQYTKAPANLIVTQADFRKISLGLRTLARPADDAQGAAAPAGQHRCCGRKMYAMGNALAIGLRKGLIDAGVPGRTTRPS